MLIGVLLFALLGLFFGIVAVLVFPPLQAKVLQMVHLKTTWATGELETMFVDVPQRKISLAILLGPVCGAALALVTLHKPVLVLLGGAVGWLIPQLWIAQMKAARRRQFDGQLVDALMLLSSSLKAGLSIIQAFEVMVEEMAPPISQEFGLVLKENKMGMAMNDSFARIKRRMPSDDLNLVLTAIMVARETGGDVTSVFGRLVETIRQRRQVMDKVKSLTFMGRLQAVVMTALPVVFAVVIVRLQPEYFRIMTTDPIGKLFLMLAVVLWLVGTVLMVLFSRLKV